MNKSDLIERIVEKDDYPLYIVEDIVNAVFDTMADELVKGEVVRISNFGVLEAKVHKARSGTNPRTGEPLTIPEMKLIGFKTALTLKAKLNK